jgi:hypothetical protein
MADTITRVYCRENQFTAEAAEQMNLGKSGGGQYNGQQKCLVVSYEMIVEWGQPVVVRRAWHSDDGRMSGVELLRVGKMAWIKLVVNVYSDKQDLNLDIYSVALQSSVQSLHAKHMFEFVGLPDEVVQQMPAPSTWANFDQQAYDDACAKIQAAHAKLSELVANYVPPETELSLGVIPNPEVNFVKSAVVGLECLASALAGRVEWDAEAVATRMGVGVNGCKQVYQTFGDSSRYLLPGADISNVAKDWHKFVSSTG